MPTEPVVLFKNTAGRVLADPAGFVRLEWSEQPRHLADTQALFGAVGRALRQYRWSRVLANQTHMSPFTPEEQRWLTQEWLPQEGHESGYRSSAIVVSSNVLSRLATAYITTGQQDHTLRYRSFDAEQPALEWLLQQPV